MDPKFWKRRRVFVTGHTGFKGGWLSLWLQNLGAKLTGYALAPETTPNLFDLASIASGMKDVRGDVRDFNLLFRTLADCEPEVVFHLAAQPLVRDSYVRPVETYAINVMGTVHLLEAIRSVPSVKAVVIITSDKCYENKEWVWAYREGEPLGGKDPYSSSKACAELVAAAYRHSYFRSVTDGTANIATARAGNVIGGGDWAADRLIPDIIKAIARGTPPVLRNPEAIRPWQHVLEASNGYLCLAESLYRAEAEVDAAWNFGPYEQDIKPVRWIAEFLTTHWGGAPAWAQSESTGPHEATYLKLDSAKARSRLAWSPVWTIDNALEAVIDWYRAHVAGTNMRDVTSEQIRRYSSRLSQLGGQATS